MLNGNAPDPFNSRPFNSRDALVLLVRVGQISNNYLEQYMNWTLLLICILVLPLGGCKSRDVFWRYGEVEFESRAGGEVENVRFQRAKIVSGWRFRYEKTEFSVDKVTLAEVQELPGASPASKTANGNETCCVDFHNIFTFENGVLVSVQFSHITSDDSVAVIKDGAKTSVTLPAGLKTIREAFGDPDSTSISTTSLH